MYDALRVVPLSVLRALARVVAFFGYYSDNSIKKAVMVNLTVVGDTPTPHATKTVLTNQMMSMADSLKAWAMPSGWAIDQIAHVHNLSALQEGFACPNGMLAIVPHIGSWEMMNAWLHQFGTPTIMYKPIKGKRADAFILKGRQKLGARLVPTDTTGVKAIFKTLKAGGFSIILPDHVPDVSGGVVVPFFGIPTLTSTLAPKLAQKTHCALVGLACVRRDDGKFDIHCYKLDNPALYHKDLKTATAALNKEMEQMINAHFYHYMWGYRRFKHTPLADNLYGLSEMVVAQKKEDYLKSQSLPTDGQNNG